jgi:hypothetical protein
MIIESIEEIQIDWVKLSRGCCAGVGQLEDVFVREQGIDERTFPPKPGAGLMAMPHSSHLSAKWTA